MSKRTTTKNLGTQVVAREKAGKVRLFNTLTAKMGKWVPDTRKAPKAAARPVTHDRMLVSELKALATTRGIPFKSKVTKPVLIAALTA